MNRIKPPGRALALAALALLSTLNSQLSTLRAQGTAFTYQGLLQANGSAANDNYDLTFAIFDHENGAAQVGATVTNSPTAVSNGLFTVTLDFGPGIFTGPRRWLEIGSRLTGSGTDFVILTTRQELTPAPYAIFAASAGAATGVAASAVSAPQLNTASGPSPGQVLSYNGSNLVWIAADGGGGSSNAWLLGGNGSTTGANFVGTTDPQPLELRVNNLRALRLEPTPSGTPNVIGGSVQNFVAPGVYGATIGGGGSPNAVSPNSVTAVYGTVSGGLKNTSGSGGTVGGGAANSSGTYDTVGGGTGNTSSGGSATVGGGAGNTSSGAYGTVGGGQGNICSGPFATVGGGYGNTNLAPYAAVGGGANNTASGPGAFVGGGGTDGTFLNGNLASGISSTVAGGYENAATNQYSSVGGGYANVSGGYAATVGGGQGNISSNIYATVAGGVGNSAGPNATVGGGQVNHASGAFCTVAGGRRNIASGRGAMSFFESPATVGGGEDNNASGNYATIPGGAGNSASGWGSFAAGVNAHANDDGSFVWGDGTAGAYSDGPNRFDVLASGGFGFYTGSASLTMDLAGNLNVSGNASFGSRIRQMINLWDVTYGIGVQNNAEYFRTDGEFLWYRGGTHSANIGDPANGTQLMRLGSGGDLIVTGSATVKCLTINGGCDLAEPFQMSAREISEGAVVVIDDENPGKLKMSERAYDTRVAGIVSGANGINTGIALHQEGALEGGQNVALSGRVYVLADTSSGPIKAGDLLTTSNTPGHAMKVTDHSKAQGAILGKAMSPLGQGEGMVLVLVTLQ